MPIVVYELFEEETFSAGVPTVCMGLLAYLRSSGLAWSSQQRFVVGGAAAPPAMTNAFSEKFGVTVQHGWGMTEMSAVETQGSLKGKHLALSRDELTGFLRRKVADWRLPDHVVFVDALPHTATGKVLKTELREDFRDHELPSN